MRWLALLLAASPAPAAEPLRLDCVGADGSAYRVEVGAPSPDGPLACVTAAAPAPVPSCAPDGGWLVQPGEGGVALRTRDPKALDREGPILFARLGPSEFVASAGLGPGAPLALEVAGRTFWRMRIAIATGIGVVETRAGEVALRCEAR